VNIHDIKNALQDIKKSINYQDAFPLGTFILLTTLEDYMTKDCFFACFESHCTVYSSFSIMLSIF
jgi:hypothetical protein